MTRKADFDLESAHRYFAAECFNRAWDLIEKSDRTAEEDRLMVARSWASIFHWLHRPDVTNRNLSVGYWQASRIQALLGNARDARRLAEVSLDYCRGLTPFLIGYAHEALARASVGEGDVAAAREHLAIAEELALKVDDPEDRELLQRDLRELRAAAS